MMSTFLQINIFLRIILFSVVVSILAGCVATPGKVSNADEKPNIILIVADDMGYSDIGCYGSEISTPNIDALAEDGLLFTQFYNAGRCCPSRASLLTGMYAHNTGVGHMVAPLNHPSYRGFLNEDCLTIAEALEPAGYDSYMTGKWHVGTEQQHWPLERGFDKFYGSNTSQGHYFKVYEGRKLLYDNESVTTPADWYATDAFTDSTIAFIQRHHQTKNDRPFFMYVAYTAPHWPIHALAEDIAKYEGKYLGGYDSVRRLRFEKMKKSGILNDQWEFSALDEKVPDWGDTDKKQEARKMAVYAAMIDRMDQGIGRIMKSLEQLEIEENTLVIFLSDNGGCAEEIHKSEPGAVIGEPESYISIGLPWANVNNTPFRKFKSWVHEGGISTPLIIKYPKLIKKGGTKTDEVGHIIDIMPTLLQLAGTNYPETYDGKKPGPPDGKSLVPILEAGKRKDPLLLYWEHEGKKAVRKEEWKLVSAYEGAWELYNLKDDRTETSDLSAQYPEKVNELRGLYESWARENKVLPWNEVKQLRTLNE
jgi:arylsulfatase A-like enzyme